MPTRNEPGFLDLFDVRRLAAHQDSDRDAPTQLGLLLLVLLLGVGTWTTFSHAKKLHSAQTYVTHTHAVIGETRAVLGYLLDAESGARGYMLTGDSGQLEPYLTSQLALPGALEELAKLLADNPDQMRELAELRVRVAARAAHLDRLVEARKANRLNEAIDSVRTGEGTRLMQAVRDVIHKMTAVEERLLAARELSAAQSFAAVKTTGLVVGGAGIVLVVAIYWFVRRYNRLRDRLQLQIVASRGRFEAALSAIGDAVLVADPEGRIVFCNTGCRSVLGVNIEDIGKPVEQLFTMFAESTGQPIESMLERVKRTPGALRSDADTAVRRADGTSIPVVVTAAALRGSDGEAQGVLLIVLDESADRERARELSRSQERFRSLVLATSQVVWRADAEGLVREDSPAWREITGQSYEQWQGRGWLDALHPEDRGRALHGWRESVAEKRPFAVEYRLRMADGTYRWTMARAAPVLDSEDGTVREWVGMNYDIQSRKEAEESQRTANRRKDEFIALLAHELRNPLAPLRHGIEILKSREAKGATRAIELMDRQVRHMVRLIDDLLDLSRMTQGKLDLSLGRVDLREILRQADEAVRPAVDAKHQRLSLALPATPMWVIGDAVRLTQVIVNLLNNSIKYSAEDADVWLSVEREGTHHVVRVRDTGQGIPVEMRSRIWDLFLQGDGRAERAEGGLGIGLTLVKRIVELHGGTVDVFSEGAGTGSEFTVRLPVAVATPEPSAAPVRAAAPAPVKLLRILVIDDNEDSAESLSMLLGIGGHEVRTAFSGAEGIDEFSRFTPDVVLCDIRMPDMSGFEVARRIRAHARGPTATLVALTGFGADADRRASSQAGFDHHVVKPADPEALLDIVRAAAQRAPESGVRPPAR